MVGGNVDTALQEVISRGKYVDFARLLTRDRQHSDNHRLELVFKGGQTFFMPAADRDISGGGVNSLAKWEQAFRVFSNIYLRTNPERAAELIQYNHVISLAAGSYTWENVYTYDRVQDSYE